MPGVSGFAKKGDEFLRIDVFGEGVRARLDDAEELFRRYDREIG